jgi:uncharacterized protein (DUF362 family)
MTRREFIQRGAMTGAAVSGTLIGGVALWEQDHVVPGFGEKEGLTLPSYAVDASTVLPDLSVARGTNRQQAIRAAVDTLGGICRFIQHGDRVMIKPNVAFDRPPALAATTHPDALRAVAQLCLEAGAREVRVADNPINSPAGCFLKSGLQAVAGELNLNLLYPESSAFADLKMEGEILRHWPLFHRPFTTTTKVIGLAPCKDHNLCSGSMSMKNWYGLLGGRRNQFHQHIHSIVADFAMMITPTLVIVDGVTVLMSNGPTGGRLSDTKKMNTVVAGTDMVAVDSYCYTNLLERDIEQLTYLHKAHARDLGNMNWQELKLKEVSI